MGFNQSHWIWHSHLIVWECGEEVKAQTQQLLVKHRSVSQAQGRRGIGKGRKRERHREREG